ncbi:hypothetical protein PHISCL_09696 [Aspergillus sclerotialis]|uniref:Uncharacterized protein n=1 Tax=Aspergillus sclerotialis TaxID=2070753 RepID=A0A3A2Z4K0_9EURO|nr:hypothetical protein PHISCL_09696 [Aspergillus sclerotialis]
MSLVKCWSTTRKILGVLLFIPYAIVLILAGFIIHPLLHAIALPYTLYYFSPNWRLMGSKHPVVDLYIQRFERLHPTLIYFVSRAYSQRQNKRPPNTLRYWPHESKHEFLLIPFLFEERHSWKFSQGAGLFALLEDAGVKRQVLWTFLRDQVESAGLATEEEKAAFARIMKKMNSHRFDGALPVAMRWSAVIGMVMGKAEKRKQKTARLRELAAPLGVPVEEASPDSVDWLVREKALVVLQGNDLTFGSNLVRFLPVWKEQKIGVAVAVGSWQLIRY